MPTGPVIAWNHERLLTLVESFGVVPIAITAAIHAFATTRRHARW